MKALATVVMIVDIPDNEIGWINGHENRPPAFILKECLIKNEKVKGIVTIKLDTIYGEY